MPPVPPVPAVPTTASEADIVLHVVLHVSRCMSHATCYAFHALSMHLSDIVRSGAHLASSAEATAAATEAPPRSLTHLPASG